MVAVVVMGNAGGLFVSNLSLLVVCFVLAAAVHTAAPVVHAWRGWRKVAANVAMTLAALWILALAASPQLVLAKTAFVVECVCWYGWTWCCWI